MLGDEYVGESASTEYTLLQFWEAYELYRTKWLPGGLLFDACNVLEYNF